MSIWEPYMGVDTAFWDKFAADPANAELKKKLSDAAGQPTEGATCDEGEFHYKVKKYQGKNGSFFKVIKSVLKAPGTTVPANPAPQDQRSKDIQKAHEENMTASKAHTAAIIVQTAELKRANDIADKRLLIEDKIREYLEALARMNIKFTPATEARQ